MNNSIYLKSFCSTVQHGSMSRAAKILGIAQPTISLHIQALEKELNAVLLERRGNSIKPTPEGTTLFEMSIQLVTSLDALAHNFQARSGIANTGTLTVAASESTLLYVLPDTIRDFQQQFQNVKLTLHTNTGRDVVQMLREDEADIAIGSIYDAPDDIQYYPLFFYDTTLIVPHGHPILNIQQITLKDIEDYGLILPPNYMNSRKVIGLVFEQNNANLNISLETGGWEVVKNYVEKGLGLSIVSNICLTGEENFTRISLDDYFPRRTYGVILRRGKFLSPTARAFLELLAPEFDRAVPSQGQIEQVSQN